MRISIVGAGPAGLYAAVLLKRARADLELRVFERNARDATFGFGVVFSDSALAFLEGDDAATHALLRPALQRWSDLDVVHRGTRIRIDGVGFAAIGRLALLQLLQTRAAALGVRTHYRKTVEDLALTARDDLVIGADGLNSVVRAAHREAFGEQLRWFDNRFAWFGTARAFERLTQTFVDSPDGRFNAHHYRYAPTLSTFIVECDAATWERAGFGQMTAAQSRAACERLFADTLEGAPLIDNRSEWRRFPRLHTAHSHVGNRVLIGDALHSAHFSIGSGTRLALEDASALVNALRTHDWQVAPALAAYAGVRRPAIGRLVRAAEASGRWYEAFASHMDLEPWPFALSYVQRSGRIEPGRLSRIAPGFARAAAERGLAPAASGAR